MKAQDAVLPAATEWDWTSAYSTFIDPDDDVDAKAKEAAIPSPSPAAACNHDHSSERAIYDLELDVKIARMQSFHAQGNNFFDEGQYDRAYLQYKNGAHLPPQALTLELDHPLGG